MTEPTKSAEEIKQGYEDALKQMTNFAVRERVLAYHQAAANSEAATQAMLDDYNKLVAEADKKAEDEKAEAAKAQMPPRQA